MPLHLRYILILGLFFVCACAQIADAQDALVLTKRKNKRLEKYFFVGDRITFRLNNSSSFETGVITKITKNTFLTNGHSVIIDSLAVVSENGRGLKFALGIISATVGGVILFTGIFQGAWVFPLGAAFFGSGLVQAGIYGTRLLMHNRYNVRDKWRFEAKQLEKEPEDELEDEK